MAKQIALIHTSPSMIPVFKALADEVLPGHKIFNMVDESLLCDIIAHACCPPATAKRLVGHVMAADEAGAQFVLVTCSSMGRAVEASRTLVGAKVLRVDEPMADRAVASGRRIGVIATLPSTLEPTAALIRSRAAAVGKEIQLATQVVDGAFDAVISGKGARHDELVGAALRAMAKSVDVIVLAQASMARVVESLLLIPEERDEMLGKIPGELVVLRMFADRRNAFTHETLSVGDGNEECVIALTSCVGLCESRLIAVAVRAERLLAEPSPSADRGRSRSLGVQSPWSAPTAFTIRHIGRGAP